MTEHTLKSFDQSLNEIDALVDEMGLLAAGMVDQSTGHLQKTGPVPVAEIEEADKRMDEMQRDIDNRTVRLIAMHQPMAQDLRTIISAIRSAGEFERIGDLSKNTARRLDTVEASPVLKSTSAKMAAVSTLVERQIRQLVELHKANKAEALEALRDRDEEVDIAYLECVHKVITVMKETPKQTIACTHLLFCAKNLERIGDHVSNIAENVYYALTGDQLPVDRPKHKELPTDETL